MMHTFLLNDKVLSNKKSCKKNKIDGLQISNNQNLVQKIINLYMEEIYKYVVSILQISII